jgi:hypothetical protein
VFGWVNASYGHSIKDHSHDVNQSHDEHTNNYDRAAAGLLLTSSLGQELARNREIKSANLEKCFLEVTDQSHSSL